MSRIYTILIFLIACFGVTGQSDGDALFIKSIYDYTLSQGSCYDWLTTLSTDYPGRLAGSHHADGAVLYTQDIMKQMKMGDIKLQECEVPHWERGKKEVGVMMYNGGADTLRTLALGNSDGTGKSGVIGEVIEVQSLDEVEVLGRDKIEGKIVFYNRPMDPTQLRTFNAYGGAVDQRVWGPSKAAEYGAVATLVRSMTLRQDDFPHAGTMVYKDEYPRIPALAISTNDANRLSAQLKEGKVNVYLRNFSKNHPPKTSYNVIGEIKGSEFPDEIIVIGGHLDSWDVGGGAHDDGAGCVHSLQVIKTLLGLNYKPKRTIRCVMFMNEENGLKGGLKYAEESNEKGEFHLAALESDAGGFTPRGFTFDADTSVLKKYYKKVNGWEDILAAHGLYLKIGGSGADIGPLKSQKGLLIGFRPDSQRYFDYHHTEIDRIEAVNQRELELGAAAITSLIYLIDKYGLH